MSARMIAAEGPQGRLWACVDPSAHHVEGKVAPGRLTALLNPYRHEDEARAALVAAGAVLQ